MLEPVLAGSAEISNYSCVKLRKHEDAAFFDVIPPHSRGGLGILVTPGAHVRCSIDEISYQLRAQDAVCLRITLDDGTVSTITIQGRPNLRTATPQQSEPAQ
jgi:hypothetical protein